jgi:hypothetical protein
MSRVSEPKPKSFEISKRAVWDAYRRVKVNKGAAGVDEQSIEEFEQDLSGNLFKLWNRLSSGSYFPPPVRAVAIPKRDGQHAVVELAIRDLKDQALAHFPSGKFLANAAWTVIAALAHNLLRWTTLIGLPDTVIPTARTLRRRLLGVPGRITRTARRVTLRMPARWPWATQFLAALKRLRALPSLT